MADKTALMVYGGYEPHQPKQTVEVFAPLLEAAGFDVNLSDTMDSYTDEDLMGSLDVVVPIWTMGTIENEQAAGLLNAIENGVGVAGWHGGMGDSFRNNTQYQLHRQWFRDRRYILL